jgi:hypothetical protein
MWKKTDLMLHEKVPWKQECRFQDQEVETCRDKSLQGRPRHASALNCFRDASTAMPNWENATASGFLTRSVTETVKSAGRSHRTNVAGQQIERWFAAFPKRYCFDFANAAQTVLFDNDNGARANQQRSETSFG